METPRISDTAGWPAPRRGWDSAVFVAAGFSVVAHLVLFGFVLNRWMAATGGGGQMLEAIEIEVVDARVLESTTATGDGGGARASAATPGVAAQRTAAAETAAAAPSALPAADSVPPVVDDARADLPTSPKAVPVTAAATESVSETPRITIETAPSTAAATAAPADAGGSAVTAAVAATPAPATAGASPEEIARFKAEVRKTLGRHRPKPGWPAGHLLLAFSVSDAGAVENVELLEPSTSERLNQLTVAWIKAIAMPSPPAGMSPDDRRYSFPVDVRKPHY